jgi:hypothetical protein
MKFLSYRGYNNSGRFWVIAWAPPCVLEGARARQGLCGLSFIIFTVNPSLQTRYRFESGDGARLLSLNLKQDVEVGRKLGVIFVRFEVMEICTNGK